MATDKATSETKPVEKEEMYRNRTKITQIVYPNGPGDKRIVPPGHTVCLTPSAAKKFFVLFEKVEQK